MNQECCSGNYVFVFTLGISIHGVVTCHVVVVSFTQTHTSPDCVSLPNIVNMSVTIIDICMAFDNIGVGRSKVSFRVIL